MFSFLLSRYSYLRQVNDKYTSPLFENRSFCTYAAEPFPCTNTIDASGKGVQTNSAQGPNGEKVHNDGMLLNGVTANGQTNTNVVSQANYYWTVYNWGGPQYSPSTRYELDIKENSYIKFREISIGYSIPTSLANRIGAKKIQLSVFGRNLFYLYRTTER